MPSAWNPFLYVKTAFATIEDVKFVPGAKNPDKPHFVDRFLFWRACALRVGNTAAILFVLLSLNDFQMAWRNVRTKLDAFPEMIRPYFSRFIYAELVANTLSEMTSVCAVFVFLRAWKESDNFERSSDLTRLGWFMNTMGPFLPYLLVPLSFFFRVDYFQRDVCASIIGMLAHDPLSSLVFAEAAGAVAEPELAGALSNPLAKPPRFGEPGFDESPAANWCWRYYSDWQPRLFSEEWMGSAMNDVGDGHNIEIPHMTAELYAGVIPKALEMMASLFGHRYVMNKGFCDNEKDKALSKSSLGAVGESNPNPAGAFVESSSGWLNDWGAAFLFRADDTQQVAALRRRLIKAYNNLTRVEKGPAPSKRQRKTREPGSALAEMSELMWPMPGHKTKQFLSARPGSTRSKFRRRHHGTAMEVDAQGRAQRAGEDEADEELLEMGIPELGGVAGGLGRQAICTFKSLMVAAMKMCAFCYILVTTAVSMYCAVSYSLPLASLILGVVDGLAAGVENVKAVLYRSCLPGYLQSITVFVTLPGILFILVFFSQIGGSPLMSLAMCCLAIWRALDYYAGEVAIDLKSPKKLKKALQRVGKQKQICLIAAAGFFVAHTLWLMYATRMSVKVDTSGAKDAIVQKLQDPFSLIKAVMKLIYVRVFTNLVTTNWILEAVFDAADDKLKVGKEKGSHVEESWARLTQGKRKKKKKKKNKDGDETTEEEGYYDEEGWYYPPPGEEGVGEVPAMPAAEAGAEEGAPAGGADASSAAAGVPAAPAAEAATAAQPSPPAAPGAAGPS